MVELPRRKLPLRDVYIAELGLGGTSIGDLYRSIPDSEATAIIQGALDRGIRYFDTAPYYGHGTSERRFGAALQDNAGSSIALSTKVGRLLVRSGGGERRATPFQDGGDFDAIFDYSRDGVLRSVEESLVRLRRDSVDILYIHDVWTEEHFRQALDAAFPALRDLRDQGLVKAIGVGIGRWEMCRDFIRECDLDCILLANRYTLLEQGGALHELLPLCLERGIGVIAGGVFNSGILATGSIEGARYDYKPAPPEILQRVRRIEMVCARHGVALQSAALQFPLRHPAVVSVLLGAASVAELDAALAWISIVIPGGFWSELIAEGLLDPDSPVSPLSTT
ncbi:MAG: aldo/keto reductase [Dongiaceae bacterium]